MRPGVATAGATGIAAPGLPPRALALAARRRRARLGTRSHGFPLALFVQAGLARLLGGAKIDTGRALSPLDAVDGGTRDQIAIKRDGATGVVVAGNGVADPVGVGVRIDDGDHRHVQLARLGDGDRLLVGVDHEHEVGRRAHVLDAAERPLELILLAGELEELLLGEAVGLPRQQLLQRFETPDRVRDGAPIGQRAAEPAVIDVVLGARARGIGDRLRRLPLGADEEDAAAFGHGVGNGEQRLVEERYGLGEIDDVDVVARPVDERCHLRIPAMGLMTEMHASLKELAHSDIGQCHGTASPFSGSAAAGVRTGGKSRSPERAPG